MSNRQGSSGGQRQAPAPRGAGSGNRNPDQGAPVQPSEYNKPPNWDTWRETGYANSYYNKMMEHGEREINSRNNANYTQLVLRSCDKEHVSDQEGKNLELGKLFTSDRAREIGVHCILFLDSAERLESKCDELKSELAVLQIELDGESDHSKDRQVSEGAVTEKSAGLEKLANTLSALLAAHKAHIRFVCNSPDFKETITDLEKKISESDSVSK
ncbi:hypothetical protein IWW39_006015 [Coemansia spiralis]|uniref:Uncharacterized protein n=1 Tax=Coemansia spiralis TaxID=417178 RepID=A0A9W8GDJ8_9FUNG|nr:hypothetical protein IWW39_006015 [Coemansia spiralis]